ncbi:Protein of unknown function DUF464 [Moorella glycerini]|uniref:Ribosomal processing cysteine protease Prp n=1 Tax=Neomoorella stamsii TaxID=1266720 RepID=A0A9X7P798_9FIRM|nr:MULTISPECIES: ribosomal-processing cysteine protease Prp [Moorella]PRR76392.1 hypothetical protein MOST_05600 [Moorella stamsii]CEP67039.1 Protein of unknown function DUF464 [Moorella glycerini]
MIRVVFWQGTGGTFTGFTVTGHAGYRPKGEDIVCAAVSALAQTAVLSLKEHLEEEPGVSIQDGVLDCRLPAGLSPAGQEKARVILKTIELGLKAIASDYRQYVAVEYKNI